MNYTIFGNTGLQVSQVALGTGNFGTGWGYGADPDVAAGIFNAYAEAGGNFIDAADSYQFGQAEALLEICWKDGVKILFWQPSLPTAPRPTPTGWLPVIAARQ
jgi:aryl-alcohol dehydrogenase-like predicted oxidoreductase